MSDAAAPRALIAFLCTVFVALGLSIASIGPALPEFATVARIEVSGQTLQPRLIELLTDAPRKSGRQPA